MLSAHQHTLSQIRFAARLVSPGTEKIADDSDGIGTQKTRLSGRQMGTQHALCRGSQSLHLRVWAAEETCVSIVMASVSQLHTYNLV